MMAGSGVAAMDREMEGARKLYLAGPDVFLVNALAVGARKRSLCAARGFDGLFPLDGSDAGRQASAKRIYDTNIDLLRQCDGVIANLTPFRGISADVGTVYEVAYALALGRPVFAYTEASAHLGTRIRAAFGSGDDPALAGDGMIAEDFGLPDNLMIAEGINAQGWSMIVGAFDDDPLDAFVACLRQAETHFAARDTTGTS